MAGFNLNIFLALLGVVYFSLPSVASADKGEFILKLKQNGLQNSQMNSTLSNRLAKKLKGRRYRFLERKRNFIVTEVASATDLQSLESDPEIEYVEPNYRVYVDPEISAEAAASSLAQTQVAESWVIEKDLASGGTKTVAVIDSGADLSHPLFTKTNALWENSKEKSGLPGVDDDRNGYVDDIHGWNFLNDSGSIEDDNSHGTHVSGIVLSAGQNIFMSEFETSKLKIMSLRFLNSTGSGTTADAIQAIYYAVDNGASVINNSWGGSNYSSALKEAYEYANTKGVIIASAAGNFAQNNDDYGMYPANYPSANNISVMAVYESDEKAGFSNFGSKTVSLAAPGVSIISSVPGTCEGGCYRRMSGTSMASPFVAGVAAMLRREFPESSAQEIKNIILETTDPVSSLSGFSISGGRVNVLKAVFKSQSAAEEKKNQLPANPSGSPVTPNSFNNPGGGGAGCGLVGAVGKALVDEKQSKNRASEFLLIGFLLLPLVVALSLKKATFHFREIN